MIKLIEAGNMRPGEFGLLMDMYRSRGRHFKDRHGWEVTVDGYGCEIDTFDDCNPLYVISTTTNGTYQGSLRLLPTTGPNMLRDVFPQLLWDPAAEHGRDEPIIESATIWESSRICADTPRALPELALGLGEVALKAGLTGVVTVIDTRMLRLLKVMGCALDVIGFPKRIGDVDCCAIMFTDPTEVERLRSRCQRV